jgi:c-di-GMP-binding flagellar brake protein YcgR
MLLGMMSFVLPFFVIVILLLFFAFLMTDKGKSVREYIHFFSVGLDSGFKPSHIFLLGKIGRESGIEDLTSLYWSVKTLDQCTAEIVRRSRQTGTANSSETQELLSRLYKYRTRLELDNSKKKRGLSSTRDIATGQRVRILLRGTGVFSSRIIKNNPRNIALEFPAGANTVSPSSINWSDRALSVYFWRQDDAGYVFDTVTVPDPASAGKAVIHIAHSNNLIRSQKRKSVRAHCSIYAQMYLVKPGNPLDNTLEPEPGMKCLLEDLSQDGAMIVIGGKAVKNMQIKLQFMIHDVLIVMAGIIRGVEFNKDTNQSRIHFECGELNARMKNAILTFVYNVLPEEKKEELDAIRLMEEDGLEETGSTDVGTVTDLQEVPDFLEPE